MGLRKILRRIGTWTCLLLAILAVFHFLLTGFPFPVAIIQGLHSPVSVSAIDDDALRLVDGRSIPLWRADLLRKPAISERIMTRGVELAPDGSIYGLVRVDHWCGNDPVRYHLARVDLTSLAALLALNPKARVRKNGLDPAIHGMCRLSPDEIRNIYSERDVGN